MRSSSGQGPRSVVREQRPDLREVAKETEVKSAPCLAVWVHKEQISCHPARAKSGVSRSLPLLPSAWSSSASSPRTIHSPGRNALCDWKAVLASSRNNSGEEECFHKEDLFWCHRN